LTDLLSMLTTTLYEELNNMTVEAIKDKKKVEALLISYGYFLHVNYTIKRDSTYSTHRS